jgi:hypothetical protein
MTRRTSKATISLVRYGCLLSKDVSPCLVWISQATHFFCRVSARAREPMACECRSIRRWADDE